MSPHEPGLILLWDERKYTPKWHLSEPKGTQVNLGGVSPCPTEPRCGQSMPEWTQVWQFMPEWTGVQLGSLEYAPEWTQVPILNNF